MFVDIAGPKPTLTIALVRSSRVRGGRHIVPGQSAVAGGHVKHQRLAAVSPVAAYILESIAIAHQHSRDADLPLVGEAWMLDCEEVGRSALGELEEGLSVARRFGPLSLHDAEGGH